MLNLKSIESNVRDILKRDADARNDDMTLYLRVCDIYVNGAGSLTFETVMLQYKLFGLPNFESVSRIRRKLQSEYPELLGSERTQQTRQEQERIYRKYFQE